MGAGIAGTDIVQTGAGTAWLERARRLELRAASARLAGHLFPSCSESCTPSGRFKFLDTALATDAALLRAVLDGNQSATGRQWSAVLSKNGANTEFLHGLAVLGWEEARASLAQGKVDARQWTISTLLLCLLFSSEEFLVEFSDDRFVSRQGGSRIAIDHPQDLVQQALVRSILSLNSSEAKQHYRQKKWDSARTHFQCVDLCTKGAKEMIASLRGIGMPFALKVQETRIDKVKEIAAALLDDWGVSLVRDATKTAEDPDAIRRLPKGIRKNYEGAIRELEPFIRLGIPIPRVLRASLEFYNTWCRDLYSASEIDRIRKVLEPAKKTAEQLMPLCTKGRGHQSENQILSEYWMLQGFTSQKPDAGQTEYEQALEWNPANSNAEDLLGGAVQQVENRHLDNAIACMEKKQFREAYEILDGLAQRARADKDKIREARAVVCFQHANSLADEGNFRDALVRAREAQKCHPGQPVIQQLVKEMEELAPEQDNLKHLKAAEQAMKKNQHDAVIRSASQIPVRSKFHANARSLASAAHFHRGVESYKNKNLSAAVSDLERSLDLNDTPEERKVITRQLEVVRQSEALQGFSEAMESENWPEAERILRKALGMKISADVQKQIQNQLSVVLNARAVQLLNEYQESMRKFSEAINEIIGQVRQLPGVR
jgi:tetratricopeptide (TPR) repeat protein